MNITTEYIEYDTFQSEWVEEKAVKAELAQDAIQDSQAPACAGKDVIP